MRRSLLVALVALAFPAVASAHATLRYTTPPFGHEVQRGPARVVLHFDQTVRVLPGSIMVLNGTGKQFALPSRVEGRNVVTGVRPLRLGAYTVRWRAISADSHVVSGVWTFGVRVPAPAIAQAYGAGGPTTTEHIVRWAWFVGLALAIGSLGFRLICLRGLKVPRELERKIVVLSGAGVLLSLHAGVAAFSLRAEDALQLPFGDFLYGDLSPMAATRFGRAFVVMTLGFAAVLTLLFLSWLLERTDLLAPAFVLSVLFSGGLSWSGHDALDPGSSWKTAIADWVHIAAASLWIGGLATMAGLLWYGAPELRRAAFMNFSRLATVLIALVLGAGTYLSIVRLPHLSDLWSQSYGRILLVKVGLVCLALMWGALHHFVVRPALERADGGFLTRLGRSLVGEMLVGVSVLLVAAVLVDSKPPIRTSDQQSLRGGEVTTLGR
ncbi:MAG: copper transport protein [Gaiellaceae bacterium]|jgi:copper transport protein|nr:copper transport protein [Gaiellaceae bacterium]